MQHASFEDDGDVRKLNVQSIVYAVLSDDVFWPAGVNEQLQQAGTDAFNLFQRYVRMMYCCAKRTCADYGHSTAFPGESIISTKRYVPDLPLFTLLFTPAHMAMTLTSRLAAYLRQRSSAAWKLRRHPCLRIPAPRSPRPNILPFP